MNVRRILVALDASPHSHAALEEAAALAAPLDAELSGIFVQDSELLRYSTLPAAKETGFPSAQRRPLNPESMERALKLQADRARKALEDAAGRHRLQASFRLMRGNVLAELLRAAKETDLLAMGALGQMHSTRRRIGSTARGIAARAECSVLLLSPRPREGKAVVAVYGQSAHASRALALAWHLSSRRNADLIVLLCGPDDVLENLESKARAQLEGARLEPVFETIGPDEFPSLTKVLARHDGGLLVLASDCELIEGRHDVLCTFDVPVLLARGEPT